MIWKKYIATQFAGMFFIAASCTVHAQTSDRTNTPLNIDQWFDSSGSLWSMTTEEFEQTYSAWRFAWNSQQKETARSIAPGLRFLELEVKEILVRFSGNKPAAVMVSIYNRGDSGDMAREQFQSLASSVDRDMTAWFGRKGEPAQDQLQTSGIRRHALNWHRPPHRAQLAWSYSTKDENRSLAYRSEFIRVMWSPAVQASSAAVPANQPLITPRDRQRISAATLRGNIKKESNGDEWISNIPMVDQGEKGYCSVATLERVMRYYGIETDQHELAQLAASSANRGTNPDVMVDALKRVGGKLGYRLRIVEDFDSREFMKLVDRYNSLAKRKKTSTIGAGMFAYVSAYYQLFDYDLLKEARLKAKIGQEKFEREVVKSIQQGIPPAWSVITGKAPETPPVTEVGGHMRLIHGFNNTTRELLYSDSWGMGHENKRMSLDDAWAITTGLYVIEPLNMRP